MKNNEIAILGSKLLGIYFIITGLSGFPTTLGMSGQDGIGNLNFILSLLILITTGLVLFIKAEKISHFLLGSESGSIEKIEISEGFQEAALRLIGIYILITTIPSLVHLFGQIIQILYFTSDIPKYLQDRPLPIVHLISQSIRFLLGLYVTLGPSSVFKILQRFDKSIEKMGT